MPLPPSRLSFRHAAFLFLLTSLALTAASAATVTGRVFHDRNRDGVAGPDEPGLAQVAVSDGREVVLTDRQGEYRLEVTSAPFVFVVLPRGYRALAHEFYRDLTKAGAKDFALVDWPESRPDDVRFVQITDTHVGSKGASLNGFIEDVEEINALSPRPAFVVATGDLVDTGTKTEQFDDYVAGTGRFQLPLFNLPGNHDIREGQMEHYHRYLGPDYYSFNAGSCHFVLLNSMRLREEVVQQWIRRDLAAAPLGAKVVFAMHTLPTEENLKLFASYGAKAVLSGHWHGHRVREARGIVDMNTPTLQFGGIDRFPRGFRIVKISGSGDVDNEVRLGGFKEHAVVVAPAGNVDVVDGRVRILVNAYDSRADVAGVECEAGGKTISLQRTGSWSWTGAASVVANSSGEQPIIAKVRATDGRTWTARGTFTPAIEGGASGARPILRLKWAAPTGGIIGISSARAGAHGIAIGLDDVGNLRHCGVSSFDRQGARRWHFPTDSAIKNHIAAADGRLFATSVAGTLYAIDEESGRLLWKADLDRSRARWEIAATTVANGIVYAGYYAYVAAFDAATGQRRWEARLGDEGDWSQSSYTVPTIAGDKLLLFHLRYGAFALNARDGAVAWKVEGSYNGPAVDGEKVYALRNHHASAMKLGSGEVLWSGRERLPSTASHPFWARDRFIIGTGDGRVCAVSSQDGRTLWSATTGPSLTSLQPYVRGGSDVNSSPIVHRDVVYIGASDGRVHAFALADGSALGSYQLGVPIASSPMVADDTLYIGGYDGNLYAFALRR
jgi:outer membrane protein assembly factor BamB